MWVFKFRGLVAYINDHNGIRYELETSTYCQLVFALTSILVKMNGDK